MGFGSEASRPAVDGWGPGDVGRPAAGDLVRAQVRALGWPCRLSDRATDADWRRWLAAIDLGDLGGSAVERPACPECGGDLLHRSGRYGPFVGCAEFPDCKYSRSV